ncbi:MAG: rhodanese-like domain-containing protein [Gammaproteobacteria bacterium]|nr:rhodanese-like domain-containing protein [Gammaproteobacteria bacterium]
MDRIAEFAVNHPFLIAALVALTILLIRNELSIRLRKWKAVGPFEATKLLNHEDGVLLDIRPIGEFSQGHIINCKHLPMNELGSRLGELEKFRDKPVVAYCRSGSRSAAACDLLSKQGFNHVFNLHGGIMAWENANLPVTRK